MAPRTPSSEPFEPTGGLPRQLLSNNSADLFDVLKNMDLLSAFLSHAVKRGLITPTRLLGIIDALERIKPKMAAYVGQNVASIRPAQDPLEVGRKTVASNLELLVDIFNLSDELILLLEDALNKGVLHPADVMHLIDNFAGLRSQLEKIMAQGGVMHMRDPEGGGVPISVRSEQLKTSWETKVASLSKIPFANQRELKATIESFCGENDVPPPSKNEPKLTKAQMDQLASRGYITVIGPPGMGITFVVTFYGERMVLLARHGRHDPWYRVGMTDFAH